MAKKKNAAAVALGPPGGLKGGKARARKLTAQPRSESGKRLAHTLWHDPGKLPPLLKMIVRLSEAAITANPQEIAPLD
jgi:hypothetical protein